MKIYANLNDKYYSLENVKIKPGFFDKLFKRNSIYVWSEIYEKPANFINLINKNDIFILSRHHRSGYLHFHPLHLTPYCKLYCYYRLFLVYLAIPTLFALTITLILSNIMVDLSKGFWSTVKYLLEYTRWLWRSKISSFPAKEEKPTS